MDDDIAGSVRPTRKWNFTSTSFLEPTAPLLYAMNEYLRNFSQEDTRISFKFAPSFHADPGTIHLSRIMFMGGGLSAELQSHAGAGGSTEFTLHEACGPEQFAVFQKYMYLCPFSVEDVSIAQMVGLVQMTHGWGIREATQILSKAIVDGQLLESSGDIIVASTIATLPGLAPSFQDYYWDSVALKFEDFFNEDYANRSPSSPTIACRLCPGFPQLWPMAMEMGKVRPVLKKTVASNEDYHVRLGLVDIVMEYIGPELEDDEDVIKLYKTLDIPEQMLNEILVDKSRDYTQARREMRLLYLHATREAKKRNRTENIAKKRKKSKTRHSVDA